MLLRPHFRRLVERMRLLAPLPAAFVYPCDRDALQLALSGAFAGYLAPVLVGPEARVREAAAAAGLDISRLPIVDTPDVPREAAMRAVALARTGSVRALVKGSLGNEDLLAPVAAPDSGLRTDCRLSHACFVELPGRASGFLLADALLNIAPNLAAKKDILHNTLELAAAIGIASPRVAVLTATASVNPAFVSTADAAALKTMAAHGVFPGAVVSGPMTADSAFAPNVDRGDGHASAASHADVMLAPGMEAASILLRALTAVTGGLAAGLVLGAKVPIVAPALGDSIEVRMASCVLAALWVMHADNQAQAASTRLMGRPPRAAMGSVSAASGSDT